MNENRKKFEGLFVGKKVKTLLAAIVTLSFQCNAASLDLMCGINHLELSSGGITADSIHASYTTAKMDDYGVTYYYFDDGSSLRTTQKGRVAYKKSKGWQSCYPLVYYRQ